MPAVLHFQAFVGASLTSPNIGPKYLSLSKATHRLRAKGLLIPHLTKSATLCVTKSSHPNDQACVTRLTWQTINY